MLNLKHASHEVYGSDSRLHIISKLSCSLLGATQRLKITKNTVAFSAYQSLEAEEKFQCSYGFNQGHIEFFTGKGLKFSGFDTEGNIRIFEIPNFHHYLATLFLPQLSSSIVQPHPIIINYIKICIKYSTTNRSRGLAEARC